MAKKKVEKREIMKVLSCFLVFVILMSLAPVFVTQSDAVMLIENYMGKVVGKDIKNNELTVQIEYKADYSTEQVSWVPYHSTSQWAASMDAINEIQIEDYIEICDLSACIGKMRSSEEKIITDVYGDPDYLVPVHAFIEHPGVLNPPLLPPLLGNYIITYENTPDCSKYHGIEISGCNVEAKYSDVTIRKENRQLKSQRLYPSQNYVYEDEEYKVDITFNSGEAPAYPDCTDQPCFGPQAFSDFTIHIKKIEEKKPDLIIQDIYWSPSNPKEGDIITFTITVKNQGDGDAGECEAWSSIVVGSDVSICDFTFTVPSLTAGEEFTYTNSCKATKCGEFYVAATVDFWDAVEESNDNNYIEKPISISCIEKPDLVIQKISWSPSNPKHGDTVKINVKTKNQGSGSAGGFYVCYYVDGSYYARDYVSSLSAGSTTTTSFTWTADCGSHSIKAVADCYDAVAESNEGNNAKTEYINIPCKPDLVVQDISWDKSSPKQGDTVTFTLKIKNQGSGYAGASYVYYYINGSYVDYDYVPALSAGSTSTQSFTWTANKCGNVQVKAVADATDAVDESNEGNNEKTKTVSVACQLDLKIIDISTSRAFPELGERLWVYVTVKNTGTTAIDTNTKFNLDVSFVDKVSVPRIHTGPAQRNGEYTFDILTKTSDVNTNLAPGDSGKYTFFWDKIPDDPAYQLILANTIRAHLYTDDYTLDQIYEETILMNLNPKSQLRCLAMSIAIKFPQTAPYIEATEKGISATEDFVNLFDALDKNEYDKAAKSFSDLLKMMVEQTIDDPLTSLIDMIKMILEYGKCFVENVIFLWNCIGHIQEWCPDFRATVFASECPVDIIVTNEQGQKIGCSQGQIINEIENADIFVKEDNKYIIIFDDGDFDVELTSTGKGEADIYVGLPNQEGIFEYADIPISQNTKAKININKSNPNNLMDIDYNGDGRIDEKKTPEMIEVTTPTTIVFEEDFGELNFNNWIPFGTPSPHILASVEGRTGVFDNNGDANCNSGVVSKDNFSFPNGFTMESDMYLNVTNVAGCWNSPVIGLTRQNKPTGEDVCPTESYPLGVIFGTEYDGDACWATLPEKRRHAYFIIGLYTEERTWESVSWLNADDYTDAWHNFKIAVGSDRIVKFYVDNDLIYTSKNKINKEILDGKKIFLGIRSSGSAGKSYHDYVKVYAATPSISNIIYVPDDYSTIQQAVNAANIGDTIIVQDGTYIENVDVNKPHLTIRPENGAENCVVHSAYSNDSVFEVTADYVNISGFTVTGASAKTCSWNAETYFISAGICLANIEYCNILNNNVSNNTWIDIFVYYSNNNSIMNNNVSSSGLYFLLQCSNNNNIYLNNFLKTGTYASYIYSDESTNTWNSPSKMTWTYNGNTYTNYMGNYRDDYTGLDANGDGIGDTAYNINSDMDNYPLMQPWENYFGVIAPTISNIKVSPTYAFPGDSINISADVFDSSGIRGVRAFVTKDGEDVRTIWLSGSGGTGGIYTGTWITMIFTEGGIYNITISATNTEGNEALKKAPGVGIPIDTEGPLVSDITVSPTSAEPGTSIHTSAKLYDNLSGIEWVKAIINKGGGYVTTVFMSDPDKDGIYTGTWHTTTSTVSGIYNINISAADNRGNEALAKGPEIEIT